MAYTLTLTHDERKAFDWIGDRYAAGDVARLLNLECCPEDADWSEPGDITFTVPEHVAWQINDLANEEDHQWPCFAPDLSAKMRQFCEQIV